MKIQNLGSVLILLFSCLLSGFSVADSGQEKTERTYLGNDSSVRGKYNFGYIQGIVVYQRIREGSNPYYPYGDRRVTRFSAGATAGMKFNRFLALDATVAIEAKATCGGCHEKNRPPWYGALKLKAGGGNNTAFVHALLGLEGSTGKSVQEFVGLGMDLSLGKRVLFSGQLKIEEGFSTDETTGSLALGFKF